MAFCKPAIGRLAYPGFNPRFTAPSLLLPSTAKRFHERDCGDELLASTEDSTHWTVENPDVYLNIEIPPLKPVAWGERHVYLKNISPAVDMIHSEGAA